MTGHDALFIDTGAFIALAHRDDRHHSQVAAFFSALGSGVRRLTTELVIAESYTWLRYKTGYLSAARFLDSVEGSVDEGYLHVHYPDSALDRRARQVLRRFRDQDLSYTDAVSLALLEDLPRNVAVFGFDHHFTLIGRTLVPEYVDG